MNRWDWERWGYGVFGRLPGFGIILGVLAFGQGLNAQSFDLEAAGNRGEVALIPVAMYLEESAAEWKIDDLRANDLEGLLNWQAPRRSRESLSLGHSTSAFWLKISVRGRAGDAEWLLQQSYPLIDRLDVYVYDVTDQARPNTVYHSGDHLPFDSRPIVHRTFVFPIQTPATGRQTIYIRVRSAGSVRIPLYGWTRDAFYRNEESEKPLIWMYYGIIGAMLVYNLFVFASVRDPSYAYYVLYLLALAIVTSGVDGNAFQFLWPNQPTWAQHINLLAIFLTCGAMTQFTRYFLELPRFMPRLNRGLRVMAWFIFGVALLGTPVAFWLGTGTPAAFHFYKTAVTIGTLLALSLIVFAGLSLYVLIRHRVRSAGYYLAAFLLFFIGTAFQILGQFAVVSPGFLTDWGIPIGSSIEVMLLSLGLADRINAMKNRLQNMNADLEADVNGRTRELEKSLNTMRVLKEKQDGDYFLTSLLIAPLSPNRARSANVSVTTLTEQKKKFSFRHWHRELGGDLCVAHSLRLRGRSCTVFLNADAMGKSMQGAGGALVIGAAFQSIIDRTQSDPASANKYPEKWLEYTFQQLRSIFESFNGSMLVSIALGVVDDETGTLYYLNAEHPWSVLYRDGVATFIEEEPHFRKLGMPDPDAPFSVRTLRLRPGDVLIAGSDGRDDLILPGNGGEVFMSEDENMFLEVVQASDGDLEAIRANLLGRGDLSDDLSLIRVEYHPEETQAFDIAPGSNLALALREARSLEKKEDWPAAIEQLLTASETNGDPALRRELVKCYSKVKNYDAASRTAVSYMETRPHDFEMLVAASTLCKKAKKFELAIDLAERACIRNPAHTETLIQLSELYAVTSQYERAAGFLEMAETNAPGDARIQKIRQFLYK